MKLHSRYKVKIGKAGYLYILVTVVISLGAANTSNNLLYLVASALLAIMLASGLSSVINLSRLNINIHPPQEIFAGIPTPFKVVIKKRRGILPAVLVGVNLESGKSAGIILNAGEEHELLVWLSFPSRGVTHLSNLEIISGFPFGFFTRARRHDLDLPLIVFPKPLPVALINIMGREKGDEAANIQKGQGDEILELRAYVEGDPPKIVDWKATARKGEMICRDMTSSVGGSVILELNRPSKNWEEALGEATYLVLEAFNRNMEVGLVLPDRSIEPRRGASHRHEILKALALA